MKRILGLMAMVLMLRVWTNSGKSGILLGTSADAQTIYSSMLTVRTDDGKIVSWQSYIISKSKWEDVKADN